MHLPFAVMILHWCGVPLSILVHLVTDVWILALCYNVIICSLYVMYLFAVCFELAFIGACGRGS